MTSEERDEVKQVVQEVLQEEGVAIDDNNIFPMKNSAGQADALLMMQLDQQHQATEYSRINAENLPGGGGSGITIDPVPTEDSSNAVASGGVYDALEEKQEKLVSGLNIKTINGQSIVGEGNLVTESDTVPFDGFILLSQITIIDGSVVDPDAILYYRDVNRFVAKKGDKYYNNWADRLLYNNGNAPYTSKLYPYDGAVYTWDGTTFAATGGTSVRYDAQTLTAQQKEQAAQNIGLDVVVKGDVQQSLSDAQRVQAQNNMMGKAYAPAQFSGLGKKVLSKNMQDVEGTQKNVMTQAFFQDSQGNELTNTVFVIQYEYVLGENITIPTGCTLQFDGGSINGEYTLTGNKTRIEAEIYKIFGENVSFGGTWNTEISYPEWFGAAGDGNTNDRKPLNNAFLLSSTVKLSRGKVYAIDGHNDDVIEYLRTGVLMPDNSMLDGNFATLKAIYTDNGYNTICSCNTNNINIKNLSIIGDADNYSEVQHNRLGSGYGIGLYGCKNVYIENVNIEKCIVDGIYLSCKEPGTDSTPCYNIYMNNIKVTSSQVSRNCMSIICADEVFVSDSIFHGNGYYTTIDLEPNRATENIIDVHFNNCYIIASNFKPAFNFDDTVNNSIVKAYMQGCRVNGVIRNLTMNADSEAFVTASTVTNGAIHIKTGGKTNIQDCILKRTYFDFYECVNSCQCTLSGIIMNNGNPNPFVFERNIVDDVVLSNRTFYNIVFNDIQVDGGEIFRFPHILNGVLLENCTFKNVNCSSAPVEFGSGNKICDGLLDIHILAPVTTNLSTNNLRLEQSKTLICDDLLDDRTLLIEKGWASDGEHLIINNSSYKITLVSNDFDIFANYKKTTNVVINSEESALVIVNNLSSIAIINYAVENETVD